MKQIRGKRKRSNNGKMIFHGNGTKWSVDWLTWLKLRNVLCFSWTFFSGSSDEVEANKFIDESPVQWFMAPVSIIKLYRSMQSHVSIASTSDTTINLRLNHWLGCASNEWDEWQMHETLELCGKDYGLNSHCLSVDSIYLFFSGGWIYVTASF